ncbi:hypothetical protein [Clostridium botulinum]|uniref:hypothetical protein n=1 Tax=Clostridium botulinum TaxID=1491 RepID=UPI00163CEC9D|nr:hypothetical protein [Clostridium botulinum]
MLVISMIWGPWVYVHIFEGFPVWKHINRAKCSRQYIPKGNMWSEFVFRRRVCEKIQQED